MDIIEEIVELESERNTIMRMQLSDENQIASLFRRRLGWQPDTEEKSAAKLKKLALAMVKALRDGKPVPDEGAHVVERWLDVVKIKVGGIRSLVERRKAIESQMRERSESLPVWPLVAPVRGFAPLGLAIIVGECGDLLNYENPAKLWKRVGLAPPSSYEMVTKSGAVARAIPRQRRSRIWCIGDVLIKQNKDGEYRRLYDDRKQYELDRTDDGKPKSQMHAHRRAQRVMEKRFLRDLWSLWRDAVPEALGVAA